MHDRQTKTLLIQTRPRQPSRLHLQQWRPADPPRTSQTVIDKDMRLRDGGRPSAALFTQNEPFTTDDNGLPPRPVVGLWG